MMPIHRFAMQRLMPAGLAAACALAFPAVASTDANAGRRQGTMQRAGTALPIEVTLSADHARKSTFSSADLGAIDVPLARVRLGSSPSWDLLGDASDTRFTGHRTATGIRGSFRDGDGVGTFTLHPADASSARPYSSEPVSFTNGAVRIAGTIIVPKTPGRHRAAVLVQGSGPEGRWAMLPLADALARSGIESLVFDKRGVGASTGDWRTATMADATKDVRAAVHVLARRTDVDPALLGVYGHSQGAAIAPDTRAIARFDGSLPPMVRSVPSTNKISIASAMRSQRSITGGSSKTPCGSSRNS